MKEEEEEEEVYSIVADGYTAVQGAEPGETELREISRLSFPDCDGVDPRLRNREQLSILTNPDGVRSYCSDVPDEYLKMISITEKYAIAMKLDSATTGELYSTEEQLADADGERRYYQQRISKITRQIQCNVIIKECVSRIRMGLGNEPFLREVIKQVRDLRETLPKPTETEEIAETPRALAIADGLMAEPWPHKEESRPTSTVLSIITEKPNQLSFARPKANKKKPFMKTHLDTQERLVRVGYVSRGDYPKWSLNFGVRCWGNAVVHAHDDTSMLTVVDQVWSDDRNTWNTRIRQYKMHSLKHPTRVVTLEDSKHQLGRVKQCVTTGVDECLVLFKQYVLVISKGDHWIIYLDKPICSSVTFVKAREAIALGTVDGSIYFYSVVSGSFLYHVDLPFGSPVLGLNSQGPNVLAWNARSVYRLHENASMPPFELHVGRPQGVAGCGSLITTLSHAGGLWISDTYTTGISRQMIPPDKITTEIKWSKEQSYHKLNQGITYGYQAVYMGRTQINVLYPCGMIRKLLFEVK
jgi:hypothetical protein